MSKLTFAAYALLALTTECKPLDVVKNQLYPTAPEIEAGDVRPHRVRSLHATIGLSTEATELWEWYEVHRKTFKKRRLTDAQRLNLVEEIGDLYWYLALYKDTWKADLSFETEPWEFPEKWETKGINKLLRILNLATGKLLDITKKQVFYGRDYPKAELQEAIAAVEYAIAALIARYDLDVEEILQANLRKLQGKSGRYQEGFTAEEANTRDLTKEENALKGGPN